MRNTFWISMSVCLAALAGCSVDSVNLDVHSQSPRPVHRTRVVHIDQCRHHAGCGHGYIDGRWIVVDDGPRVVHVQESPRVVHVERHEPHRTVVVREPRTVHVHDDHCGCAWDGRTWIVVGGGHRHGPRCGHVYISGRWTIR